MKRLALLAVLGSLALPGVALGHAAGHATNPLALAYKHAIAYLHGAPCRAHVTIRVGPMTIFVKESMAEGYGHLTPGEQPLSWAEWDGPLGHNDPEGNPATFTNCIVTFNREYWWSWTQSDRSWETVCVAMIHELGNLYGLPETLEAHETTNLRDALLAAIVPPPACTHYRLLYPNGHREAHAWNPTTSVVTS